MYAYMRGCMHQGYCDINVFPDICCYPQMIFVDSCIKKYIYCMAISQYSQMCIIIVF